MVPEVTGAETDPRYVLLIFSRSTLLLMGTRSEAPPTILTLVSAFKGSGFKTRSCGCHWLPRGGTFEHLSLAFDVLCSAKASLVASAVSLKRDLPSSTTQPATTQKTKGYITTFRPKGGAVFYFKEVSIASPHRANPNNDEAVSTAGLM